MVERRYIACKFRESDTRAYTYHWDGDEDFKPGDKVRVVDKRYGGWNVVTVEKIVDEAPPFATSGIICKHVDEPEQDDLL